MASSVDLAERPVVLQGVPSPGYSAIDLRRLAVGGLLQEGVVGSGSFAPTPGAGAKQIAVASGEAGVEGDSTSNQGRYYQRSSGTVTLDLATAPDATNPRIDQVVLEIKDDVADGSGLNVGRLRVISGTATVGATLDNRSGAAALPSTCMRIADVLVPANYNAVFVAATHIRDRRPWARGFNNRIKRTQNAAAGSDYTTASFSMIDVDATNLALRVECSGAPLRIGLIGRASNSGTGNGIQIQAAMDGAQLDNAKAQGVVFSAGTWDISGHRLFDLITAPAAGSHLFKPQYMVAAGGTAKLSAAATDALFFHVEELPGRPFAGNGLA